MDIFVHINNIVFYTEMEKKLVYEAPAAENVIVNFEENFLQTGGEGINPGGDVPDAPDGGDD